MMDQREYMNNWRMRNVFDTLSARWQHRLKGKIPPWRAAGSNRITASRVHPVTPSIPLHGRTCRTDATRP